MPVGARWAVAEYPAAESAIALLAASAGHQQPIWKLCFDWELLRPPPVIGETGRRLDVPAQHTRYYDFGDTGWWW